MPDEEFIYVNPGAESNAMHDFRPGQTGAQRQHNKERRHSFRRSRDYFRTLAKAAEESNKKLEAQRIPMRFCVYWENDAVFIDIVRFDEKGKIISTVRKNISEEDFNHWIEDIWGIEGLVVDREA